MGLKVGGALPLQATPPGADGPLARGILVRRDDCRRRRLDLNHGPGIRRSAPRLRFPKALSLWWGRSGGGKALSGPARRHVMHAIIARARVPVVILSERDRNCRNKMLKF